MVVFEATATLAIASAVWVLWRVLLWRRNGGDPVREAVVAMFFVWCLWLVRLTFFPMVIIFYDWHSKVNLIPFASILQLIEETNSATAFRNIAGNIILFIPLGFLFPILFARARTLGPLIWRAAVISAVIEVAQVFTKARSIDIDDVLLNTIGAAIGWVIYSIVARIAERNTRALELLGRAGASSSREPLLRSIVPIAATLVFVIPMMLSSIFAATLGEGSQGIEGFATEDWPGSSVLARGDVAEHTFLVVGEDEAGDGAIRLYDFERVLPGRYTWVSTGEIGPGTGSRFSWSITAFNSARGEIPTVVVWGSNFEGASRMNVSGNGITTDIDLPTGTVFAVGFQFDIYANPSPDGILQDFEFSFFDDTGADVTTQFRLDGR